MPKRRPSPPATIREPVQVYLAADDAALLARIAGEAGLSKAEVLRRGVRAFAREQQGESPMLAYFADAAGQAWPAGGMAADHDAVLADAYAGHRGSKRR